MRVLDVGDNVILLRFLADGRRLLAGVADGDEQVSFTVCPVAGGKPVPFAVPKLDLKSWTNKARSGNAIAVHPTGESCYIAWDGRLFAFRTADGGPLPVPRNVPAHQVVLSPAGDRLLAGHYSILEPELIAATVGPGGGTVVRREPLPVLYRHVVGFLPDGDRYVTIEEDVRIRAFDTGAQLAAGPSVTTAAQPQLSADGRQLGLIAANHLLFFDLTDLGPPRKLVNRGGDVDFESFAFHPDGKTVAVIHGGPTLVKVYDLATLKQVHKWNWKVGPLSSVAYSPDGTLGAAGSRDGRIVVWDVDE